MRDYEEPDYIPLDERDGCSKVVFVAVLIGIFIFLLGIIL